MKALVVSLLGLFLCLASWADTTYDGPTFASSGNTWTVSIRDDASRRRIFFYFSDQYQVYTGGMFVSKKEWRYLVDTYRLAQRKLKTRRLPGSTVDVKLDTPGGYGDGPTIYFEVRTEKDGRGRIIVKAGPDDHFFHFYVDPQNQRGFESFLYETGRWFATVSQ